MLGRVRYASLFLIAVIGVGCDDTTTLRITFEGAGEGAVHIHDQRSPNAMQGCTETCELDVAAGFIRLDLTAIAYGLAIAELDGPDLVVAPDGRPQVGPLNEGDDLEITARFTSWVEAPVRFATIGQFAPDGDLITGNSMGLAKAALTGEPRWATEVVTDPSLPIRRLAVTAAGETYALHGYWGVLVKLDANGAVMWSKNVPTAIHDLAAMPNGDLLYLDEVPALRRLRASDGMETWSVASVDGQRIAVAPNGDVYVSSRTGTATTRSILRFTSEGVPITPSWTFPADLEMNVALAIDMDGVLLAASHVLQRIDPATGTVLYERQLGASETDQMNRASRSPGIEITASNQAFVWIQGVRQSKHNIRAPNGTNISVFNETGDVTFTSSFAMTTNDQEPVRNLVQSGTCDRSGHCAVFGTVPTTIYEVP